MSLSFLVAGDILLVLSLEGPPAVTALLQIPVILIMYALRWLYQESDPRLEQVAIGAGAKAGNGLLLALQPISCFLTAGLQAPSGRYL